MKDENILNHLNRIDDHITAIRKHISEPEPKERPEPIFKVGDMTNKGKIIELVWGENRMGIHHKDYEQWNYRTYPITLEWWDESELVAVPSKFLVESNGIKMQAYRMQDGRTEIEIDGESGWHVLHPNDPILTALGFNADNIQNYCCTERDKRWKERGKW